MVKCYPSLSWGARKRSIRIQILNSNKIPLGEENFCNYVQPVRKFVIISYQVA